MNALTPLTPLLPLESPTGTPVAQVLPALLVVAEPEAAGVPEAAWTDTSPAGDPTDHTDVADSTLSVTGVAAVGTTVLVITPLGIGMVTTTVVAEEAQPVAQTVVVAKNPVGTPATPVGHGAPDPVGLLTRSVRVTVAVIVAVRVMNPVGQMSVYIVVVLVT